MDVKVFHICLMDNSATRQVASKKEVVAFDMCLESFCGSRIKQAQRRWRGSKSALC